MVKQKQEQTFGQKYFKIKQTIIDGVDYKEASQASKKQYVKGFMRAVERGAAQFSGNFFIEVLLKEEPLFGNTPRRYFIPKEACPRGHTNQAVYLIDQAKEEADLWWSIPNMRDCIWYLTNPEAQFLDNIGKYEISKNVHAFYSLEVDDKADAYNKKITKSTLRSDFNPADWDDGDLIIHNEDDDIFISKREKGLNGNRARNSS